MPCFRCEECGCVENTALGHYWCAGLEEYKGTRKEKALCSECLTGKWHGRFPKEKATEDMKGELINY